jgi:hypothetical protein
MKVYYTHTIPATRFGHLGLYIYIYIYIYIYNPKCIGTDEGSNPLSSHLSIYSTYINISA